jgi:hypothetical protein
MDFWKTLLVLVRRWYVALPIFLMSAGLAAAVFVSTPTYYQSTGLLVLTTPPGGSILETDPAKKTTLNPLLAFDDGLKITATLLIQNVNSPVVVKELTTSGKGDSYTVSNGNLDGPFISVQAESQSPQSAKDMVQNVLDRIRDELKTRQTNLHAPAETFINLGEVVTPTVPETKIGGKVRSAGAALALGIAGGLTGAYGTESYLTRRRRKTDAGRRDGGSDEPTERMKPPERPDDDEPHEPDSWAFVPPAPAKVTNGSNAPAKSPGRWPSVFTRPPGSSSD